MIGTLRGVLGDGGEGGGVLPRSGVSVGGDSGSGELWFTVYVWRCPRGSASRAVRGRAASRVQMPSERPRKGVCQSETRDEGEGGNLRSKRRKNLQGAARTVPTLRKVAAAKRTLTIWKRIVTGA